MATPPVIARARVRLGFLFRGFNFRGSPVNRENRENRLPRKFLAKMSIPWWQCIALESRRFEKRAFDNEKNSFRPG